MSLLNDIQTLLRHAMWEDSCNKDHHKGADVGEGVFVATGFCNHPILYGDPEFDPYSWIAVNLRQSCETYCWKRGSRKEGKVEISWIRWNGRELRDTANLGNFMDTSKILQEEVDLLLVAHPWADRAAGVLVQAVQSPQLKMARVQHEYF